MRSQQQAFRAYYASMTNSELLQTARNRSSFIDVAQKELGEELKKRNLSVSAGPVPAIQHSFVWTLGETTWPNSPNGSIIRATRSTRFQPDGGRSEGTMKHQYQCIELRVVSARFGQLEPVHLRDAGHIGHRVHFYHHAGVIREVTMSAAMQAYLAVRQGRLMQKWLQHRRPVPVYVWNADQDVCLAAFILEYHEVLERLHNDPLLRWIVQFNNKIDVCGGLYLGGSRGSRPQAG